MTRTNSNVSCNMANARQMSPVTLIYCHGVRSMLRMKLSKFLLVLGSVMQQTTEKWTMEEGCQGLYDHHIVHENPTTDLHIQYTRFQHKIVVVARDRGNLILVTTDMTNTVMTTTTHVVNTSTFETTIVHEQKLLITCDHTSNWKASTHMNSYGCKHLLERARARGFT